MSVRLFTSRIINNGFMLLRHICKREIHPINITEKVNVVPKAGASRVHVATDKVNAFSRNSPLKNVGLQLTAHARRIFVDNVLNRVTNSSASELRRRATRRIFFGDSGPFFALVGVSLASGSGILTKEEELEGICWEIREAISKIKWNNDDTNINETEVEETAVTLNNLEIGVPLDKGANAVVYAAKLRNDSQIPNTEGSEEEEDSMIEYPLALKMMFNYDVRSDAGTILRAMSKEIVPVRKTCNEASHAAKNTKFLPPHPNIIAMYRAFADNIPTISSLKAAKTLFPNALPTRLYPDGDGRNMSLFIVMKRYNMSLEKYLISENPSMRIRLLLFCQLLEGVTHMFRHEIAHRDLKSDNLLLDTSEQNVPVLVITDFGCCLADKSTGLLLPYTSYEIDKGGNVALMAPEIVNKTPGSFATLNYTKSDLWASGAIAYEIFGMTNPFYDGPRWSRLKSTDYKEDQLPELPDDVPEIVKFLVGNILKRNPKKRLDPETAATIMQLKLWAPSSWLSPGMSKLPTRTEIIQWLLSLATKILCEGRRVNGIDTSSKSDVVVGNVDEIRELTKDHQKNNRGRRTYPEYLLLSTFLSRTSLSNIKKALNWIHDNYYYYY
ncbi:serine/threonine-protein kinase PINK1, mitochondrial [Agrilus planipennis]|uniref:non-specific serine/threonine protein kinase n=1 Tax=Agrilus planipennis TaxID=224129 RepID=A0A7F5R012_AGRPL|nr:serine/threonine-protein kinase PINK1, mitochondrial [Agrilus planipennis]